MKFSPLKKGKDITRTLKMGKRIYTSSLTLVILSEKEAKFAVCVGKKYGKSVQRNRLKRLLREAFRFSAEKIEDPCFVLLIPKPAPFYSFEKFRKDVGFALDRECRNAGN